MRRIAYLLTLLAACGGVNVTHGQELLSYSKNNGASGLRLAWRADSTQAWTPIGKGYNFVNSDFGPWGSHKKMFSPRLVRNAGQNEWVLIWEANPGGGVTGVVRSKDLMKWTPQQYYSSATDVPRDICPVNKLIRDSITIDGKTEYGFRQPVEMGVIETLQKYVAERGAKQKLYDRTTADDAKEFGALGTVNVKAEVQPDRSYVISPELIGIFFEDINYGADGGLYAELVQNRDFEYSSADRGGWDSMTAWTVRNDDNAVKVQTDTPLHPNNPHYLHIDATKSAPVIANGGYDGIPVKKGEQYKFSIFVSASTNGKLTVALKGKDGKEIARGRINVKQGGWRKYALRLKSNATCDNAELVLTPERGTRMNLDMVSLFPAKTFKGRDNGLRPDLAQTLADLKPKFVRFPGGCVAHGNGVDNIYDWKGSIGPLESRKPLSNLWGYHQTRGLGYHEYFQFCEDIGASPLPVVAAGVPCQNSGRKAYHSVDAVTTYGQQNGIPMDDMDRYVQDVLDLIEYANGPVTSEWGAKRAAAGHPAPFNLKYIGIGNEDMITEVFEPRFKMIYNAVRERYPDITVVGTVGPFYEGTDYDRGWELARELNIPMVDEHYYVAPGWLINNRDYYDRYERGEGKTKVYLGEWAAHLPGRPSNMETALAEALYLTDVERNGDVVSMTSYAPLLAKKDHTQWTPDLIYFDNTGVHPTTDYYVQQLFGRNSGDEYVPSTLTFGGIGDGDTARDVRNRTGLSVVRDKATGQYIVKMVNMLPVPVRMDVSGLQPVTKAGTVKGTRLAGTPKDKAPDAVPVEVDVNWPEAELPPYSLTVVRL